MVRAVPLSELTSWKEKGPWGQFNFKFNGPVILVGFSLDPRIHRGGCAPATRGCCAGVEEEQRQGGRRNRREDGEVPLQSRTAVSPPADPAQPQFLGALWSAASHVITLPQLLDLIQNVLQEKFGLPMASAVAYFHMVIGA